MIAEGLQKRGVAEWPPHPNPLPKGAREPTGIVGELVILCLP